MWYFAWVLGLGLAAAVGIMNALWFELKRARQHPSPVPGAILTPSGDKDPSP